VHDLSLASCSALGQELHKFIHTYVDDITSSESGDDLEDSDQQFESGMQNVMQNAMQEAYADFQRTCFGMYSLPLLDVSTLDASTSLDRFDVHTHRLVFRVFYEDSEDSGQHNVVYKMVGCVRTLLCKLQVQNMNQTALSQAQHSVMAHPMQWCIALLDRDSALECGRVTLVNSNGNQRVVEDSLVLEMKRMGIVKDNCLSEPETWLTRTITLPTVDGSSSRDDCSVGWFIENWSMLFERHSTVHGVVDIFSGSLCVPGQALNLPIYLTHGSCAMQKVINDIRILWNRSFHVHQKYTIVKTHENNTLGLKEEKLVWVKC
jgi:hypothetical protein